MEWSLCEMVSGMVILCTFMPNCVVPTANPILVTFFVCTDGVTAGSPTLCIVVGRLVDVVVVGRVALVLVGVQCFLHADAGGMYLGIILIGVNDSGSNLCRYRSAILRTDLRGHTSLLF